MEIKSNSEKIHHSDSRRKFMSKFGMGSLMLGALGSSSYASMNEQTKPESNYLWDPFDFGAKGDGKALDTLAIQAAIDQCNKAGGGKVYLNGGCFISGTIYMKSNVSLYLEAGTILKASDNLDDFPIISSKYPSYTGTFVTNKMLIYAEDQQNISICGRGKIDGNGDHWVEGPYGSPSFSLRPRIIHFRNCENIHVRDIIFHNSASWVQSYQSCRNMVIEGIHVDSREYPGVEEHTRKIRGRNTDGLDLVDCQQVRISNCFINSGDDAICLKSFSPDEACQDIVITNCVVSSNAGGIKIGTETSGGFRDITIQNCVVYNIRQDAIFISTVDGSRVERINISNISLRNIRQKAIFIRLGIRNREFRKNAPVNTPYLKDIIIENIQGTDISSVYCCTITGLQNNKLNNIVLKNINLQFEGGGKLDDASIVVPELEEGHPNGRMFGKLPAYGFFIRHAKNVILEDIRLNFAKEDQRPAVIAENVEHLEIKGLKASGTSHTPELIRLKDTTDVIIAESRPTSRVPSFLSVQGDKSDNIILLNNFLKNMEQYVKGKKSVFTESGTIK